MGTEGGDVSNGPKIVDIPGVPSLAETLRALEEGHRLDAERRRDRQRAREMFVAAGKPIPAWAREPEPTGCAEDEDVP